MITLKNVLVATDFNEPSKAAIEHARGIAEACGATLHVLHVVTEPLDETWFAHAPGTDFLGAVAELESDARHRLERLAAASPASVIATSWGEPTEEILKYAREQAIDLIVLGTHGRRGWARVVLGSVAERTMRQAHCPVLTVPARLAPTVTRDSSQEERYGSRQMGSVS